MLAMTFDRYHAGILHTFSNPTADLDTNRIVELNIKSTLVDCSRWHVILDLEMKNVPVHETKGFHAV